MAPPKKDTEALTVRLPREIIAQIDDVRRLEEDIPTRPEMIRRILQDWLESKGKVGITDKARIPQVIS